jgi:hypothetical protein
MTMFTCRRREGEKARRREGEKVRRREVGKLDVGCMCKVGCGALDLDISTPIACSFPLHLTMSSRKYMPSGRCVQVLTYKSFPIND